MITINSSHLPDKDSPKNYPEDNNQENGNYICQCVVCKDTFTGNKHRSVCKECKNAAPPTPLQNKGAWVKGTEAWPNKTGSFTIKYLNGNLDTYYISIVSETSKKSWESISDRFEWWYEPEESVTPLQEAEKEKYKAGDLWKAHIKQFSKLDEFWNNLPEATNLWLSQQIDNFAKEWQSNQPQQRVRWVKASERLPKENGKYFCKVEMDQGGNGRRLIDFYIAINGWGVIFREKRVIEWLDDSNETTT